MRRFFSTVFGPQEPAFTAGSFAIRATGRPPTVPIPVTTPSAPSPSCSQLASSPSSARESASRSLATRSRTGSFSCSATFLRCRSGPPSSAASRAALTSLTTAPCCSGPSFLLGLAVDDLGLLRARLGLLLGLELFLLALAVERVELVWLVEGVRSRLGPVLGDGAGQLGAELFGVGQHVVATADEVGDHGLDVLAALGALLDDPARLSLRGRD